MHPLRNVSLRTTVLLLVTGTLVCLLLFIMGSLLWVTRRESERASLRDFHVTDIFLRQILKDHAATMQKVCGSMGSDPHGVLLYLMSRDGRDDRATVGDVAEDIRGRAGADAVVITDRAGRILGESAAALSGTQSPPGVATALTGTPWSGMTTFRGRLGVAVTTPIFTPGQRYVQGTVTAFALVGTPLARTVAQALACEVAFVVGGQVAGQSGNISALPPLPAPTRDDEVLPLSEQTVGGRRYVGSYHLLRLNRQSEPVGVLILHPYDEATALRRSLQAGVLGPFAASLVLALLVGAGVARHVTRPLEGIVRAAFQLREGRWPDPFAVERGDEIGLLQTMFNEMTVSLRQSQERLVALLDTDPLTDLDNHRRFQERLAREIARADAGGGSLCLLLLDIDEFGAVNSHEGHSRGDALLRQVAGVLRGELPLDAIAARYGGDEFALLIPQTTDEATELAEALRDTLRRVAGVTLSVGIAAYQAGLADGPAGLTLAAELALTQAKQLGRDRVYVFEATPGGEGEPLPLHRFLRDGSLATIQALAAAVDAKDPYTQGHSRRVADLARRLAQAAGLSDDDVYLVFTSGTLHDVGKIGVPDSVLQKPGRLDDEERRLMETHPALGAVIVGKVPQLTGILPGVRSHHEHWNGAGYPDGLAGEAIPLIARILALADTFDAMTSDRPYRNGLPVPVALAEICRCAGVQFDPALTPLFVGLIEGDASA